MVQRKGEIRGGGTADPAGLKNAFNETKTEENGEMSDGEGKTFKYCGVALVASVPGACVLVFGCVLRGFNGTDVAGALAFGCAVSALL